jgi:hypothetical protein
MTDIAWEMTQRVRTVASLAFAWNYWTTVSNWDDPPAVFELHGPFQAGSLGITRIPGQAPIEWRIQEVDPPNTATIAMPLTEAVLLFEWRFDGLPDRRTQISQSIRLVGDGANAYVAQVSSVFAATLPGGMNKIARAITNAHARQRNTQF